MHLSGILYSVNISINLPMRIKTIGTQKNAGQLHALTKKGAVWHLSAFIEF